jgi:hypothetical protein
LSKALINRRLAVVRFSVRDLLWLTLVAAVGLGWLVRERQLGAEVLRMTNRADERRGATGALEYVLKGDGWKVRWDLESLQVRVKWNGPPDGFAEDDRFVKKDRGSVIPVDFCEPSAKDD